MMQPMQLSELARRFGWAHQGADVAFERVVIDSRAPMKGALFVAIQGERYDGHDFVNQAAQNGAAAVLLHRPVDAVLPQLVCADTQRALAQVAGLTRSYFNGCLLGLTGSAGKTTTKAMIAHVLASQRPTLATKGNFNNEIGVPLTLLELLPSHAFAVVEMGAAKPGDIAYLCDFVKPDIGLVTNAYEAHIEGMGSLDGVAKTKGEIFEALAPSGTAVINADSSYFQQWQQCASSDRVLSFGWSANADVRAENLVSDIHGSRFTLCFGDTCVPVVIAIPGEHNIANALAAAACCIAAGASVEAIADALASFTPVGSRLTPLAGRFGSRVIDDTYNANPSAFRAAIDVLSKAQGRRLLVAGDMAELGEDSVAKHQEVGAYAFSKGIDCLFCTGITAPHYVLGFGENGRCFESQAALIAALLNEIKVGDTVLVKGSRSAAMEKVVAALVVADQKAPNYNSEAAPC